MSEQQAIEADQPEADFPPEIVAKARRRFAATAARYPALNQDFDQLSPKARRQVLQRIMEGQRS